MKEMNKSRFLVLLSALVLLCGSVFAQTPKYVFYFIADGMGINSVYGTEIYNAAVKGEAVPCPLTFSSFPVRTYISNYSASSLVTDSSAAGTALACGEKVDNGAMAVTPDGRSLVSIARKLKDAGYGAAVVSTTAVNHATPSSFYANDRRRNHYNVLNDQLLEGRVDFAAGAGFIPKRRSGETSKMWVDKARKAGWNVLVGASEFGRASESPRTICLACDDDEAMPYAMQNPATRLADMTRAAIANMEKFHPEAFFIMIEGGRIDYAAHENDAVCMFQEINDMDASVDIAMDFASRHPGETLIIVTSDHETGGLCLGHGMYELHPEVFLYQNVTKGDLSEAFGKMRQSGNATWDDAKTLISKGLGLWDKVPVSAEEEADLKAVFDRTITGGEYVNDKSLYADNELLAKKAIDLLCAKAMFHFSTNSHTGAQVPLFVYGACSADFGACRDQVDVPAVIEHLIIK